MTGFDERISWDAKSLRQLVPLGGPKYHAVRVQLVGEDGNAFAIIGRVSKALREAGVPQEEVDAFREQASGGDYNNLLRTCMGWVDIT